MVLLLLPSFAYRHRHHNSNKVTYQQIKCRQTSFHFCISVPIQDSIVFPNRTEDTDIFVSFFFLQTQIHSNSIYSHIHTHSNTSTMHKPRTCLLCWKLMEKENIIEVRSNNHKSIDGMYNCYAGYHGKLQLSLLTLVMITPFNVI